MTRHVRHCTKPADSSDDENPTSERHKLLFEKGDKDDIYFVMKNDPLIRAYGEEMIITDRYDAGVRNSVREKMRTITRILLEMKKTHPKIMGLKSIFYKKYWGSFKSDHTKHHL